MVDAALSRDFEMLVFGDGGGTPLILFSDLVRRYSQNKDFGLTDSIAAFVDSGKITIYCPDSADLDSFITRRSIPRIGCGRNNAFEARDRARRVRFRRGAKCSALESW